jgi:methylated-DNA-protein-cysteine methyltransferase-like protein
MNEIMRTHLAVPCFAAGPVAVWEFSPPMPKPKSKAYTRIRAEVIRLVGLIPSGKFTTYGSIAVHMNIPALFVGSVMGSLTDEESATLPWHRVVSSDARISPNISAKTARLQRKRLEAEDLRLNKQGYIQDADAHFHVVGVRRNIRWSEG